MDEILCLIHEREACLIYFIIKCGEHVMGNVLLFIIGFGFAIAGGVTIIAYLNFLPAGITWVEYIIFIRGRIEVYFLPIGILMVTIAIFRTPFISK